MRPSSTFGSPVLSSVQVAPASLDLWIPEPGPPSIRGRVNRVVGGLNRTTMAPTQTMRDNLALARTEFDPVMRNLKDLVEIRLAGLEQELEQLGAPYTPGRLPSWD